LLEKSPTVDLRVHFFLMTCFFIIIQEFLFAWLPPNRCADPRARWMGAGLPADIHRAQSSQCREFRRRQSPEAPSSAADVTRSAGPVGSPKASFPVDHAQGSRRAGDGWAQSILHLPSPFNSWCRVRPFEYEYRSPRAAPVHCVRAKPGPQCFSHPVLASSSVQISLNPPVADPLW
jgi:hypothetical protein